MSQAFHASHPSIVAIILFPDPVVLRDRGGMLNPVPGSFHKGYTGVSSLFFFLIDASLPTDFIDSRSRLRGSEIVCLTLGR